MEKNTAQTAAASLPYPTVYPILFAVCVSHMLNDLMQAALPSLYPMLKDEYHLTYLQIGMITFVFQVTASIFQPFVGTYTDKYPRPYSFVGGMVFTLTGIILLAFASNFTLILLAAGTIGLGSSIFHPEASRVSYLASGNRRGLAQSIFQLGGNMGYTLAPILVLKLVLPYQQVNILWFAIAAILAMIVLTIIGGWYKNQLQLLASGKRKAVEAIHSLDKRIIRRSIAILLVLIFSKYFYTACISNYFTFYLIEHHGISKEGAQVFLFLFMLSITAGTVLGGPLGDRFGRKIVIWFSILGAAPFTIMLPFADLFWTGILVVIIGLITSSSFSAILVYAQELLPGKIGMISGLFYGFAFGMAGLGAAVLGQLIDATGITTVFIICSYLPLIGIITIFLPNIRRKKVFVPNPEVIDEDVH